MPKSTAPSIGPGSRRYWRVGQPRSPLLNRHAELFRCVIKKHAAGLGTEQSDAHAYGLLAIFPIGAERDFSTICAAALEAGRAARDQIAALCASWFGAVHVGDVLFGNIGSGNRLDFTCIGPGGKLGGAA